jgi:hypothetical protein
VKQLHSNPFPPPSLEPSISAIYQNKPSIASLSSGSNGSNGGNKTSQPGSSSDENSSANISVGEKDTKSTDQANNQQANAAAGNSGAAAPAPVATSAAPASFSASGPKKISWSGVNHVVWMSPDAITRLREKISQKAPLEIEVK